MRIENKVTNYDINFSDKDINVLIECIRKSKLTDCRDQVHAWELLDQFVEIFLNENKEKYINRYLTEVEMFLKYNHKIESDKIVKMLENTREMIEDENECVFKFDSEDWADYLVRGVDYYE